MKQYVKTVDEFYKDKMIKEALMLGGPIEIPGLNFVTADINGDELILTTEKGRIYPIDIKFINDFADDTINDTCPSCIINANQLFQDALKAKADSFLPHKIDVLKQAESFALFEPEIEKGGFFANLESDLNIFGMETEDIDILTNDIYAFYTSGHMDNMTPTGLAILREYLDYWMEIVASVVYIFLHYCNNVNQITKKTQGPNIDKNIDNTSTEEISTSKNEMLTNETLNIINEMTSNSTGDLRASGIQGADYESNLRMILNMIDKAAHAVNIKIGKPYDYDTCRDINSTTKTIVFPILDDELSITAILNPVLLQQETGSRSQSFSLQDGDGIIHEYENIIGLDALIDALKNNI